MPMVNRSLDWVVNLVNLFLEQFLLSSALTATEVQVASLGMDVESPHRKCCRCNDYGMIDLHVPPSSASDLEVGRYTFTTFMGQPLVLLSQLQFSLQCDISMLLYFNASDLATVKMRY